MFISDVDLVTPLCSQVTYEGVLDETFGITSGKHVEFTENRAFEITFVIPPNCL